MVRIGCLNWAQFASAKVELKGTESNASWDKGVHRNRARIMKLYQCGSELSKLIERQRLGQPAQFLKNQ